uniref:Uncharacterized protein n=1 Tax=Medicago truncatula TaxID=3880 RepID=A2Q6H5_MEDTR|nr:hypothetical protein MtrDRAFT_AC184047g9v2 [Medicago truncatula]
MDTIERYRRNTRSAQPMQRSDEQNMQPRLPLVNEGLRPWIFGHINGL